MARHLATPKRLLLATAVGIVLVLSALPALAEGRASGYPLTLDVRMTAKGDLATPFNFVVQPGRVVELRIHNYTREFHTFAIPAIGLNAPVLAGSPQAPQTAVVRFVVPRYGIYRWFCWTCRYGLHSHQHMSGRVYAWISPDLDIG